MIHPSSAGAIFGCPRQRLFFHVYLLYCSLNIFICFLYWLLCFFFFYFPFYLVICCFLCSHISGHFYVPVSAPNMRGKKSVRSSCRSKSLWWRWGMEAAFKVSVGSCWWDDYDYNLSILVEYHTKTSCKLLGKKFEIPIS